MPQQAVAPAEERYAQYIVRSCPKCRSALQRVWRRPIDRFVSLFVPVHRFRCEKFVCQWAGNLRVGDTLGPSVQPETDNILLNPVPARVPRTFIGSMVLVAVGIVAIILVPVADLVGNDPQAYLEPSDYQLSVAPKLERLSAQPQRDAGSAQVESGGVGSVYGGAVPGKYR